MLLRQAKVTPFVLSLKPYAINKYSKKLRIYVIIKWAYFSRNETFLEPNVHCLCTGENRRYGIKYRCRRKASTFLSSIIDGQTVEQSYCSVS